MSCFHRTCESKRVIDVVNVIVDGLGDSCYCDIETLGWCETEKIVEEPQ